MQHERSTMKLALAALYAIVLIAIGSWIWYTFYYTPPVILGGPTNAIVIGYKAAAEGSNTTVIGTKETTVFHIYGMENVDQFVGPESCNDGGKMNGKLNIVVAC